MDRGRVLKTARIIFSWEEMLGGEVSFYQTVILLVSVKIDGPGNSPPTNVIT